MNTRFNLLALAAIAACALPAFAQEEMTTVSGYGGATYRWNTQHNIIRGKDYATDSNQANIDRFVIFLSHSFNDNISFKSELEVEDTKITAGNPNVGEVEVEQMFLDFGVSKSFNVRAGEILVPVGIINETHEPPTFNGNTRPELDNEDGGIIPTTWRDIGAGAFGQIGDGWNYRGYFQASMLSSQFTHDGGIGGGKQEGQRSNISNLAVTGRIEYTGTPGLKAGASFYFGGTSGGDTAAYGGKANGIFAIPLTVLSADARYTIGDLQLRGEFAMSMIDADDVNQAYHMRSANDSSRPNAPSVLDTANAISKGQFGFYVEAAYNVLKLFDAKAAGQLLPFIRFESINLNSTLATGEVNDNALVKTAIDWGLTYKPLYNVAVKFDVLNYTNKAYANAEEGASKNNTVALGIGYMF